MTRMTRITWMTRVFVLVTVLVATAAVALPQPDSSRVSARTKSSDGKLASKAFSKLGTTTTTATMSIATSGTNAVTTNGPTTALESSSTFSNSIPSQSAPQSAPPAELSLETSAGQLRTTSFVTATSTARTTSRTSSRPTSRTTSKTTGRTTGVVGTASASKSASTIATVSSTDASSTASSPSPASSTVSPPPLSSIASSRKSTSSSTSSSTEYATTSATISAKETRESPGKIRPQIKLTTNFTSVSETGVRLPEGASAALAKPTKYHYYPHNQHIYLLPECAVQQVCNAVYVRLNFTQPLCACPGRYRDPCSASLDSDDLHTTELVTDPRTKALTLVKTCEPVAEMRECRTPRDWSLLALQNVRTGKSHYLVICRCPDANILEGPMSHDQPTYASVPGIRVYGMMCVQGNRRGRPLRYRRTPLGESGGTDAVDGVGFVDGMEREERDEDQPRFPWHKVHQLTDSIVWD